MTASSRSDLNRLLAAATATATTTQHGTLFEYISDWALMRSAEYGHHIKTIERYETWARRERPDLSVQSKLDGGVDRIITTHAGETWAVQNKGYGVAGTGSLSDLTNFVAQGRDLAQATKLIWVTSGRGLNSKAAAYNKDAGVGVIVLNRDWLADATTYPGSLAELRAELEDTHGHPHGTAPHVLRRDQEVAVTAVVTSLETHPSVQLIAACGAGKTVVTHSVHDALASPLTVFFVPTLGLMRQSIRAWERQAGDAPLNVVAVCSDQSVIRKNEDALRLDEQSLGKYVIRKPLELAHALAHRAAAVYVDAAGVTRPMRTVVFCTYQSAHIVVDAQHHHGAPTFELAVMDEAHYLVGDGDFGEIVKDKPGDRNRLRAVKRVYTTATPKTVRSDLRPFTNVDSMHEDSPVFGPRAYVMTFGEAIQLGILSGYKLSIVVVPDDEIVKTVETNRSVIDANGNRFGARALAAAIAVKRAASQGDTRFVSYHHKVKSAQQFATLTRILGVTDMAATVSGAMNAAEREETIEAFAATDGTALLSNCRVLNEGVDIPSLSTVLFVDPKAQVIDIVQSIGRVLRRHEGKTLGHIIVPIPVRRADISPTATIESISAMMQADERWATAFRVIKALGEHDTVIQQQIDTIALDGKLTKYKYPKPTDPDDVLITGNDLLDEHVGGKVELSVIGNDGDPLGQVFITQLTKALRLATIREVAGTWALRYGDLRTWLDEHDSTYPNLKHGGTPAERQLARWVGTQRSAARRDALTRDRRALLEALPGWLEGVLRGIDLVAYRFERALEWKSANGRMPDAGAWDVVEAAHAAVFAEAAVWGRDHGVVIGGVAAAA